MNDELERLMREATPLPWRVSLQRSTATEGGQPSPYNGFLKMTSDSWDGSDNGSSEANAALIVAAVNALPELLAERDRLREALNIFVKCIYPTDASIDSRGYCWSEAWLDEALPIARAALNQETPGNG